MIILLFFFANGWEIFQSNATVKVVYRVRIWKWPQYLIGYLYLIGVWLRENQRPNNIKDTRLTHIELWLTILITAPHSFVNTIARAYVCRYITNKTCTCDIHNYTKGDLVSIQVLLMFHPKIVNATMIMLCSLRGTSWRTWKINQIIPTSLNTTHDLSIEVRNKKNANFL